MVGKVGPVFHALNWAWLNGLSSDTCGRLCDWVMPRSVSRNATSVEVIEANIQPEYANVRRVALCDDRGFVGFGRVWVGVRC